MSRFKPIGPSSARRYLDTETGKEVSRRQRDKIEEAAGNRVRKGQGFIERVTAGVQAFWEGVKEAVASITKPRATKPGSKAKPNKAPTKAELKAARAKVVTDLEYQIKKYKRTGKGKPAPFVETFTNKTDIQKARDTYAKIMGEQAARRNGTARQGRRAVGGYSIIP